MKKYINKLLMIIGGIVVLGSVAFAATVAITSFTQTVNDGDTITSSWYNNVNTKLKGTYSDGKYCSSVGGTIQCVNDAPNSNFVIVYDKNYCLNLINLKGEPKYVISGGAGGAGDDNMNYTPGQVYYLGGLLEGNCGYEAGFVLSLTSDNFQKGPWSTSLGYPVIFIY